MMRFIFLAGVLIIALKLGAQSEQVGDFIPVEEDVEIQPLLAQVLRMAEALSFIGAPLPQDVEASLRALQDRSGSQEDVDLIQLLLDPFCLYGVQINPEARVKVDLGPASPILMHNGWKTFLVKVHNAAAVTAPLQIESPNGEPTLFRSSFQSRANPENILSPGQVENRFLEVAFYNQRPMKPKLSGLPLEYKIVQIYTSAQGNKEGKFNFHIGQGTQDIGFRNSVDILFEIDPAVKVKLEVRDTDGTPTMASFIFTDGVERLRDDHAKDPFPDDYRLTLARMQSWEEPGAQRGENWGSVMFGKPAFMYDSVVSEQSKLVGIYPLPARRTALVDEYPDFFFQAQVYRADGEHVYLPPGKYQVRYGRGPEYLKRSKEIEVPPDVDSLTVSFALERWVHMAELGWYSSDHHIHAAGCSHYESPAEGVKPEDMWRQIKGEDLNIGLNLAWGPCWYYQKDFFSGETHPLSDDENLMRYDVEVSGFPSSHAGHLVLLNLSEDDYPGTSEIEEWPSYTLPVLQWAKEQNGVVGYAHSGNGLEPFEPTSDLPNFELPRMDGIGANEYIMSVAHDAVDIYSLGNTPSVWELNMWYHTLNVGFRTRISGETDFPCVTDERVGQTRSYIHLPSGLEFNDISHGLKMGRSYVSDGFSHLMDFTINDQVMGQGESEVAISQGDRLDISVRANGMLDEVQGEIGEIIAKRTFYEGPYWNIEKARIGKSRNIPVELIVNGIAVDSLQIPADGEWQDVHFSYVPEESAWIAIRVLPSSHTNPIFVQVDGKPICDSASAQWCLDALEQCWKEKGPAIRPAEIEEAAKAYEQARSVYMALLEK